MSENQRQKPRILSGMRPTGKLHLGNLVGALENWVKLQDEYESFHFVADWHMLTTDYADPSEVRGNTWEIVADWVASGLDPERATFFVQSWLPEHAELHLLFCMVTPLGWLERVPTYKEQLENIRDRDLHTYGFLGYPVLQAADILMYKANFVPVGEDQVPHVELTRQIARRFNLAYGEFVPTALSPDEVEKLVKAAGTPTSLARSDTASLVKEIYRAASLELKADYLNKEIGTVRPIFPEPQALLTPTPRLPGTDGRKMSKSYDNAIFLSDPPEVVSPRVANMMTDPARKRRTDPGNPDVCPVFDHHRIFSPADVIERVNRECRTAGIGCVDCNKLMAQHLNAHLAPIQERRRPYEIHPQRVWDILRAGTEKARKVAQATMAEVREAVKLA